MRTATIAKIALLIAVTALLVAPPAVASEKSEGDTVGVIAHRGSSGIAPENTEAAISAAIKQDADFVEIDVQRTKDGRLVNFHDCTMERTTDAEERFPGRSSYRVSDFTWDELQTLDAGSWFHEKYARERIITVRDVIEFVRGKTGLLAEISPCGHYAGQGLPAAFDAELRSVPGYVEDAVAEGELGVQSFVVDDAKTFKALAPEVPIGVLDASRPTEDELVLLSEWADDVNPQYTVTDSVLVARVHELGMGINVWTVNEPGAMRRMAGLGVDGIITDYPQSLTQR